LTRLADAFGEPVAPRLGAELVDLIAGAPDRLQTLRGTIRDWTNFRLATESAGRTWDDDLTETGGSIWRVWFEFPTSVFDGVETPRRLRVERLRDGRLSHLAVRDGDRWWAWKNGELAASHDGGDPAALKDLWLHVVAPTWTFSQTVVESGARTWVGRDAVELEDPAGTRFLGPHSDFARYLIDAERGVALRAEVFVGGASASVEEFLDLVFDEPLDPGLFDGVAAVRKGQSAAVSL
jgi:hypothetical protein